MVKSVISKKLYCAHCGLPAHKSIEEDGLYFCCHGCKTAHHFLSEIKGCEIPEKQKPRDSQELNHLDSPEVIENWIIGKRGKAILVRFSIPNIHCASCVQVLERLYTRKDGIIDCRVNFLKKETEITYLPETISFREVVAFLDEISYGPNLSENGAEKNKKQMSESMLWTLRMAMAGFCAGNIMLLSFPDYLGLEDESYQRFFGWLNLFLAMPAVFFSGWIYLKAVYTGITKRILNIDVPIGVGMIATLILSLYEIISGTGTGYFDSLTGLIFFLLIGRWVQNRTFQFLSFERDFKSYFPLSVIRLKDNEEEIVISSHIKKGDLIKIRHGEIVPCDGIFFSGEALIDYSFVSGESNLIKIEPGKQIMAGGKQNAGVLILKVTREMSGSHLVTLWNNPIFKKEGKASVKTFADSVAFYFTPIVLLLATLVAVYWAFNDPTKSWHSFVSILIIACPCTLALAYPIALGNTMRLLGKNGFFLKKSEVVENMAQSDTLVFDKTGTLTDRFGVKVEYLGSEMSQQEKEALASTFSSSTHPLSSAVSNFLKIKTTSGPELFNEEKGQGLRAVWNEIQVEAGSANFLKVPAINESGSHIYIKINDLYKGCFIIKSSPLPFVTHLIFKLGLYFQLHLLSGDHAEGQDFWQKLFENQNGKTSFAQTPESKLLYINKLQNKNLKVAMVGDGLNDAGALKQANVGIAIAADAHQFTPGSDAILLASELPNLSNYFQMARNTMTIVKLCFLVSLLYNAIGLSYAIMGNLEPIVAAILMPASSLSVVLLAWAGTEWTNRK